MDVICRMPQTIGDGWILQQGWCSLLCWRLSSFVCQSLSNLWWASRGQCCLRAW